VVGAQSVADAGQEVGDRIGLHRYQLDLVSPGIMPSWAISRRQMRQSPNLRRYARGRPHRLHRL
jgi:hypothetical protein